MEGIIVRVNDLARKIDEKILGYPLSPPVEKSVVMERLAEVPREMAALSHLPLLDFSPCLLRDARKGRFPPGSGRVLPFPSQ